MIEITQLYKYYGERRAIGPLSCSIAAGEIVGLLGLNGAGKTTTLRILACDLLPSAGTVTIDGLDVVERPHEVRARIGYLPDTPPLYAEMTVHAYLHFAARLRGMSRADAERRVPEVEDQTELGAAAAEPISSLSHGFKQRVGIAQAIVHRPKLLVFDEPISGLDPVQIVEMRGLLRNLKGDHTIVVSSHILSEISETCDRILVIKDGQIAAAGTEAELVGQMRTGVRAVVTVRGVDEAKARSIAEKVAAVQAVQPLPPAEGGAGVLTLQIDAARDIRAELCRALVSEGVEILQIGPGDRELESVFLQLATPAAGSKRPRNKPKTTSTGDSSVTEAPAQAAEPLVREARTPAEKGQEGT